MADRAPAKGILRWLLVILLLFLALLILLVVLQLTESALNVWQMLEQMSPGLLVVYGLGLVSFTMLLILMSSWLLRRGKGSRNASHQTEWLPGDRDAFAESLRKADEKGIETAPAKQELAELDSRQQDPVFYLVFFGPVSAGKSALIRAISGQSDIAVDPRAGTTQAIKHYRHKADEQGEWVLTDAPGILDLDEARVQLAREEARRAHLVLYVSDGELTRDQYQELAALQSFGRPLILALNKQDRYSPEELKAIVARLSAQLPGVRIVPVQAGGSEEVIRVDAQGHEQRVVRPRPPQVDDLLREIGALLHGQRAELVRQRDESLIRLGAEKLQTATVSHRKHSAEKTVKQYTGKAMLGAMAAVSPGTDLLIQGYLGVQMVRALCETYEVRVSDMDLDDLVKQASRNVGKKMTLLLALTGNVLKAFPGVGTVTGGLTHAVAYGMIFESLGQAVMRTLEQNQSLKTAQILDDFEEKLSGNLEARATTLARIALEQLVRKGR
ncbi:MAG: GTPase [Candidatus Thiodiazotropha sp.]